MISLWRSQQQEDQRVEEYYTVQQCRRVQTTLQRSRRTWISWRWEGLWNSTWKKQTVEPYVIIPTHLEKRNRPWIIQKNGGTSSRMTTTLYHIIRWIGGVGHVIREIAAVISIPCELALSLLLGNWALLLCLGERATTLKIENVFNQHQQQQ